MKACCVLWEIRKNAPLALRGLWPNWEDNQHKDMIATLTRPNRIKLFRVWKRCGKKMREKFYFEATADWASRWRVLHSRSAVLASTQRVSEQRHTDTRAAQGMLACMVFPDTGPSITGHAFTMCSWPLLSFPQGWNIAHRSLPQMLPVSSWLLIDSAVFFHELVFCAFLIAGLYCTLQHSA